MKNLFNYLSVMALLMLCACNGATNITLSSDAVNFPIEGGNETVSISADGSWEITSCPDWVVAEKHDSVLSLKTERNETGKILQGNIVLSGKKGVEVSLKVTQATKCTHITPSEEMVEFDKEGGTKTVSIDTDGTLQVTAPEGFTATYKDGVLTITAYANDGGKRKGEIDLSADEQSAKIDVSQKGNICPRCNGTGKVKCTKCGGKGIIEDVSEIGQWSKDGCTKCGGSGWYALWGESSPSDVHPGSGKMTCPQCGGSGH